MKDPERRCEQGAQTAARPAARDVDTRELVRRLSIESASSRRNDVGTSSIGRLFDGAPVGYQASAYAREGFRTAQAESRQQLANGRKRSIWHTRDQYGRVATVTSIRWLDQALLRGQAVGFEKLNGSRSVISASNARCGNSLSTRTRYA
jgi:hypothetical protein